MKISVKDRPALILMDIQKVFDKITYFGEHRNNDNAEENAATLLKLWRNKGLPVIHVKHCSKNPDSLFFETNKGNEFKEIVLPLPEETVIKKSVSSAFIDTNLKEHLDNHKITKLVIAGLTTDHCVSTTARMAGNLGYDTYVISDATATFNNKGLNGQNFPAELMHETALASLNSEFAWIVTTEFIKQSLGKN